MALNFPLNPSVNETYVGSNGYTYKFNGIGWDVEDVSVSTPSSPWGDLYLSGNTIHLGENTLTIDNSGTLLINDQEVSGGGGSNYSNANVKSYLTSGLFDGNLIPAGNSVYSIGSLTHQWKSLYVSTGTIYINGVPLSLDSNNAITINGNTVTTTKIGRAHV